MLAPRTALATLIGAVAFLGLGQAPAGVRTATAGPERPLVVVGTGGLSAADVSERATPNLWAVLRDGASADLVVHSVHANTCPVDGWLGLSAGGNAAAPRPGTGPDSARPCPALPEVTPVASAPGGGPADQGAPVAGELGPATLSGWSSSGPDVLTSHGGPRPGALAAGLGIPGGSGAGGFCVAALGPGAAVAAADASGRVERYGPWRQDSLLTDLAACPVVLVDVGSVRDGAARGAQDLPGADRAARVAALDERIGAILAAAPEGGNVLVASLADAGDTPRLRLALARGPDFGPGLLSSPSTRQDGLVQSADLTATILRLATGSVPEETLGQPLEVARAADNSERRATGRLQDLVDLDLASHEVRPLVEPFFTAFAVLQILGVVVFLVWWRRSRLPRERIRRLVQLRNAAVFASSVPVATFLANLIPWWRFPVPAIALVGAVGLFVFVVGSLALTGPWSRSVVGPLAVVSAATFVVLVVDVLMGSRLQLSSLMGLQPLVGGRFYGIGNVSFALLGTATLLLMAATASVLARRGLVRPAAVVAALIGAAGVIVDGAPFLGADGGGLPALLPAVVLLVLVILAVRITALRLLAVGAGTLAFVVLVAVLDWLRPPSARSHLGAFVQRVLDGNAGEIVVRKWQQNIDLLSSSLPRNALIPLVMLYAAWMLARRRSWGGRLLTLTEPWAPVLRPALAGILLMSTIGFLINDSGMAIPPVAGSLALPALAGVFARALEARIKGVTPGRTFVGTAGRRARPRGRASAEGPAPGG